MRTRYLALLPCITLLLLAGCGRTSQIEGTVVDESLDVSKGRTDENGKLIFYTITYQFSKETTPVSLKGDYGMMVFFNKWKNPDLVRYELYVQDGLMIYKTTNLEKFKSLIAQLPEGSNLDWYNTCQMGTCYGLDERISDEIYRCCKDSGVILDRGPHLGICTCP